MGILNSIFGSSEQVTRTRPQVMEGLEPLVPELSKRALQGYTRPYQAYQNPRIAGFSGSQQGGMNAIRGVATDPSYRRGMGQAGEAIGSSMDDQNLQSMIQSLGRTIKPTQTRAGQTRAGQTSTNRWNQPGVADSYMSPYKANVIDQYLNREGKRTGERRAGLDAKLAGKRAFGSRGDLARTQFESDEEDRKSEAIAKLMDQGYESGASRFATDEDRDLRSSTGNVDRSLTSQTGNMERRLTSDTRNADRGLEAERLRTTGIGQGITGENTRLAGRRAAGNDLSSLSERYRTGNLDSARALMNVGNMEQQQGQKNLDLGYEDWNRQQRFPEEQAKGLAGIVYGAPTGSTTTTPGPSAGSQILGAGIGLAGLGSGFGWWADGGEVKRFANGGADDGISDDDLLAMLNDPDTDPVTKESIKERLRMSDRAPAGIGVGMPSAGPPAGPMTPDMRMGREDAMPPPPTPMPQAPPPVAAAPPSEPPGEAAADPYSALLAKLVEAQDPKASRGMILAKLGAAMASSRQPGFFGPVGEGIGAAARGMEDEKARSLRALGTAATIEERRQSGKERAANTKLTQERLRKGDEERALDRSERRDLSEKQRQDMKDYRDAMAGQGRWSVAGQDPDGNVILLDTKSADGATKTVVGMKPKATGAQGTADTRWVDYAVKSGMVEDTPEGRTQAMELKRAGEKPSERPRLIERAYNNLKQDITDRRSDAEKKAAATNFIDSLYASNAPKTGGAVAAVTAAPAASPAPKPPVASQSDATPSAVSPPMAAPPGGAGKRPTAAAVELLKKNPTPQARKQYDAVFGAGAAAQALGG